MFINEIRQKAMDVVLEHSLRPFDWEGDNDCCAFVRDMLLALHGRDFMEGFDYGNKVEACQVLRTSGGLVGAVSEVLGKPKRVILEEVQEGDVLVALNENGEWTLGIAFGGRMLVRTHTSVMDWPYEFAQRMWRPV